MLFYLKMVLTIFGKFRRFRENSKDFDDFLRKNLKILKIFKTSKTKKITLEGAEITTLLPAPQGEIGTISQNLDHSGGNRRLIRELLAFFTHRGISVGYLVTARNCKLFFRPWVPIVDAPRFALDKLVSRFSALISQCREPVEVLGTD